MNTLKLAFREVVRLRLFNLSVVGKTLILADACTGDCRMFAKKVLLLEC